MSVRRHMIELLGMSAGFSTSWKALKFYLLLHRDRCNLNDLWVHRALTYSKCHPLEDPTSQLLIIPSPSPREN